MPGDHAPRTASAGLPRAGSKRDGSIHARAYDRILKVSRTIADLAAQERLTAEHVSEAVRLRSLDRQLWGRGK